MLLGRLTPIGGSALWTAAGSVDPETHRFISIEDLVLKSLPYPRQRVPGQAA